MTASVLLVISGSICLADVLQLSRSTSANTGVAPAVTTAFAVATNVNEGMRDPGVSESFFSLDNVSMTDLEMDFTNENKVIFEKILSDIKNGNISNMTELGIDQQLIDKIFKFASIKHILNNYKNNPDKIFDLLKEIIRDLKNYELEHRIEELESKFSKDLSESTFNELKELKKLQKIN